MNRHLSQILTGKQNEKSRFYLFPEDGEKEGSYKYMGIQKLLKISTTTIKIIIKWEDIFSKTNISEDCLVSQCLRIILQ